MDRRVDVRSEKHIPVHLLYKAQSEQKHQYNKKSKNRQFKVKHKVLVLLPTEHNKLTLQWRGAYVVEEVVNRLDFKVEVNNKIKIYHDNLLKMKT